MNGNVKDNLIEFVDKELALTNDRVEYIDREYILHPIKMRLTENMQEEIHLVMNGEEIIGFGEYFLEEENDERILTIIRLYIAQEFRRKGYGKAMLGRLIEKTSPDDCRAWLMSNESEVMFNKAGFNIELDVEDNLWAYRKFKKE